MERNRVVTGEGPALQERSLMGSEGVGGSGQGVNYVYDREMKEGPVSARQPSGACLLCPLRFHSHWSRARWLSSKSCHDHLNQSLPSKKEAESEVQRGKDFCSAHQVAVRP